MPGNRSLNVDFCRSFFPTLNDDWAFLENAGGTYVPTTVIERLTDYMRFNQVQPGAGFEASAEASDRMAAGRACAAALINAEPDEIAIGPSTTANVYVLAHGLRPWFAPGDEVIVTDQDHEANNGAWRRLSEIGVTVREWRLRPETSELHIEDLDALLTERTRLVCFTGCSNIVGTLYDVAEITRRVHAAGALVCADGVAWTPHRRIDVKALDVDFFLYSLYKVYGPHIAVLYGKGEHLRRAENQNHHFVADDPTLKLNPGGPNHELTAASAGIGAYFDRLYDHHFRSDNKGLGERISRIYELIGSHEDALSQPLAAYLGDHTNVRLYGRATGDGKQRVAVFSFTVEGRDSREVAQALNDRGLAVRAGDFYTSRCVDALGARPQNGVIRASMCHYNSVAEIGRLIEALDAVI